MDYQGKTIEDFVRFTEEVKRERRTFLSTESLDFLEWCKEAACKHVTKIPKDKKFFRARKCEKNDQPISIEGIKPVPDLGSEGRANAYNISMLYLSDERDIAISEIRPGLREPVTVATFLTNRDLQIVDFAAERPDYYWYFMLGKKDDPKQYHQQDCLLAIGDAFSKPLSINDSKREYIPTQILAEYFKSLGYDGVAYQSQFCVPDESILHKNYALFDLDAADAIGFEVCEVEKQFIKVQTKRSYQEF